MTIQKKDIFLLLVGFFKTPKTRPQVLEFICKRFGYRLASAKSIWTSLLNFEIILKNSDGLYELNVDLTKKLMRLLND